MKKLINWLKRISFEAYEEMDGYLVFEKGYGPHGRHPLHFEVTWGPYNFLECLTPGDKFLVNNLCGAVTADWLCSDASCKGTLTLGYYPDHILRYEFTFCGDQNMQFKFVGEKVNIQLWNLPVSHTTCFSRITEVNTGRLVATGVVFFRMSTALDFLKSFRLVVR